MDVREIIARRTDLGTFLVHLTRGPTARDARANLESILRSLRIEARTPFGPAVARLQEARLPTASQQCVCFTETPLEHAHLLLADIDGRAIRFQPYGIAIPKKIGRSWGINPVWYQDITPGHDWLTQPTNGLINEAIGSGAFPESHIEMLAPFIEQMGTQIRPPPYRKEFWWEREWRIRGNVNLRGRVICLCPEEEHGPLSTLVDDIGTITATFVDPRWGLEQIIARLAGFSSADTDIL